jgi:16S rRNA processing protein RimM
LSAPERLLVGEIGKPHGLSGEVYVMPISDDPARFEAGSEMSDLAGNPMRVESSRRHGNRLLVKFVGIDSREAAQARKGALYVHPEDLRALGEDEFWPHDIVGSEAVTTKEETLGKVVEVLPGAAQDLLVIETSAGRRLVPLVKDIVVQVNVSKRRVVLDPPEGLME